MNARRIWIYAVKVDGEGWLGVGDDVGRCDGHGHETPELAKLCALHRAQPADAGSNVVLMPVPAAVPRERRRAAGDNHRG
jgi:hypothetical protein